MLGIDPRGWFFRVENVGKTLEDAEGEGSSLLRNTESPTSLLFVSSLTLFFLGSVKLTWRDPSSKLVKHS